MKRLSEHIAVQVQPRSSRQKLEALPDGGFKIWVHSAPDKGNANKEVLDVLARHLNISPSTLKIIKGRTSRRKVIAVNQGD